MRQLILMSVCLLGLSQFAHAALFDDKEARQQIQDLQQKQTLRIRLRKPI